MTREEVVKAASDAYSEAMGRKIPHDKAIQAVCNAVLDEVRCLLEQEADSSQHWAELDAAITAIENLMAPVK